MLRYINNDSAICHTLVRAFRGIELPRKFIVG
jgi:hypothetical protein